MLHREPSQIHLALQQSKLRAVTSPSIPPDHPNQSLTKKKYLPHLAWELTQVPQTSPPWYKQNSSVVQNLTDGESAIHNQRGYCKQCVIEVIVQYFDTFNMLYYGKLNTNPKANEKTWKLWIICNFILYGRSNNRGHCSHCMHEYDIQSLSC